MENKKTAVKKYDGTGDETLKQLIDLYKHSIHLLEQEKQNKEHHRERLLLYLRNKPGKYQNICIFEAKLPEAFDWKRLLCDYEFDPQDLEKYYKSSKRSYLRIRIEESPIQE